MNTKTFKHLTITEAQFLPIIKEYAKRIQLIETVNRMVDTKMAIEPGIVVLAMVLDTLSGRSPLYRLPEFLEQKDTELLLGSKVQPEQLTDHNVGRVLDKIYETGTHKIFSEISLNAVKNFQIETAGAHFDTTSITVYGDYDFQDAPLNITHGYSKDKRPDLKQFLIEMLCVDRDIPVLGRTRDGNASDKTLNNELLGSISSHMAKFGLNEEAFVYVADSAFVTSDNLKQAQVKFVSRLPATYSECGRVIREAVKKDKWERIGVLAQTDTTQKKPAASYKAFDTQVMIDGIEYRAVVVHSSAHDKRRHKKIDHQVQSGLEKLEKDIKKILADIYYCEADALAAAKKIEHLAQKTDCFLAETTIEYIPVYKRGRPKQDQERAPEKHEYHLKTRITEDEEKTRGLRYEAGCFVLLTNLSFEADKKMWDPERLLSLYKNQSGIERNFGFLKDPVIVNSVFLKKPERIEVLGMILVAALLIWRLLERSMREYLAKRDTTITGCIRRRTKKPTSFMMTTKFISILVIKEKGQRFLARPLKPVQLEYLDALGVPQEAFLFP